MGRQSCFQRISESVALKSKLQQLKKQLEVEDARDDSRTQPSKKAKKRADISKKKKAVEKESPEIADQPVKDISLDPQYFLKVDVLSKRLRDGWAPSIVARSI